MSRSWRSSSGPLTGQEIPRKSSGDSIHEELEPAHTPGVAVVLSMQHVQVCRDHQITRPDHRCRPDYESATNPGEREPGDLGGKDEENTEADAVVMVVPQLGRYRHIQGVGWTDGGIGHDNDDGMLLDVERSGIEAELPAPKPSRQREVSYRKKVREEFAARVNRHSARSKRKLVRSRDSRLTVQSEVKYKEQGCGSGRMC